MSNETEEADLALKIFDALDSWYSEQFHSTHSPAQTKVMHGVDYGLAHIVEILEDSSVGKSKLLKALWIYKPERDNNVIEHGGEKAVICMNEIKNYVLDCAVVGNIPEKDRLSEILGKY